MSDSSTNNWEDEILQQFDEHAADYSFPMLNNVYFQNAGVRLTAFRNNSEWLILFQEIAFSSHSEFVNMVSAYGNKLESPGLQEAINIITITNDQPDLQDNNLTDLHNFRLYVRGQLRTFTPSLEDYSGAKIDIDDDSDISVKVLRLLTFTIPAELFLSDDDLLEVCGRSNTELQKFIQLDEWYHPDIADDEIPSENECLKRLAVALSNNNKELYSCPEELVNTHWSNWIEG